MSHVDVKRTQQQVLKRLGIPGVALAGALVYDCYPQGNAPLTYVTGATGNVDTAYQTIVANSAIAVEYFACLPCLITDQAGSNTAIAARLTLRRISGSLLRKILAGIIGIGNQYTPSVVDIKPMRIPANIGLEAAMAAQTPAFVTMYYYQHILRAKPIFIPELMRVPVNASQEVLVSSTPNIVGVAMASSTAFAYSTYNQVQAGISTPILLTALTVGSDNLAQQQAQVSFATGAAAAEIDFAVFGHKANFTAGASLTRYQLPVPIYIPANTRIAARVRASSMPGNVYANGEYIPLPMAA